MNIQKEIRMEIFNLITVALTLLALVPKTESQIRPPVIPIPKGPRPLCASQFALVNYACSRLPFIPVVPPDSRPSPDHEDDDHRDRHHNHSRRHNRRHEHDREHRHEHDHEHRHEHDHRRHQTPEEDNCCRWAKEVDDQCVCQLLGRLPPFLIKPVHQYTLNIGEGCDITYSCGAPI